MKFPNLLFSEGHFCWRIMGIICCTAWVTSYFRGSALLKCFSFSKIVLKLKCKIIWKGKSFLIGVFGFNLWRHPSLRRFELRFVVKQMLALYSLKFFEVIFKGLKKSLLMLFREVIAVYCENLTKRSQAHLFSYPVLKLIQLTLLESLNFQNCVLHII